MAIPGIGYRLKACGVLYQEHRTVNAKLAELAQTLLRSDPPEGFAKGLGALVRFLDGELPPHFAKEEEALFPVLESVTGQGFPPVEVMKAEHAFLIEHFTALRDAAGQLERSPAAQGPRSQALAHLFPLAGTLDQHIVKEDTVLFVMACDKLDEPDDKKMLRIFDEIDRARPRWP